MAGRLFMTKWWGFGVPTGPLQFSQAGWREKARKELNPGDQVLIVGTKGSETHETEQGRLLGLMEPSTEPVMSLDFVTARGERDFDDQGNYRWPYGLLNKRAWRFIDRPNLTPDISTRKFSMDSAQGIVLLTNEEAARVAVLQKEEVPLLAARVAATARVEGVEAARKRSAPPPTTTRRGVMHMRSFSAYTYAMEVKGPLGIGFKIGWAFDFKQRARQFELASMPALGGVKYTPKLFHLWDTARQAFAMEQALLRQFEAKRHRDNHEVVTGITLAALQTEWVRLVSRG